MIDLPPDAALSSLFFAYMRDHGVHIWEGRPGFLTLMHSDANLDRVCEAFRTTLEEMHQADFLPRVVDEPPTPKPAWGTTRKASRPGSFRTPIAPASSCS